MTSGDSQQKRSKEKEEPGKVDLEKVEISAKEIKGKERTSKVDLERVTKKMYSESEMK